MTIKDIKKSVDLDSLELYLANQYGEYVKTELDRFYVKDDVAHLKWNVPPFAPKLPLNYAAIYTGKKLGTVLKVTTTDFGLVRSVIVTWSEQ